MNINEAKATLKLWLNCPSAFNGEPCPKPDNIECDGGCWNKGRVIRALEVLMDMARG